VQNSQTGASRQPNPLLIFDEGAQLPVQFRDTMAVYAAAPFSLAGPAALNISGSCQFSQAQLQNLVSRIGRHGTFSVYLVDLRQESHVFINGTPVSWYAANDWANVDRSPAWIEQDETLHLIRMIAMRSIMVSTLVKGEDGRVSTKDPAWFAGNGMAALPLSRRRWTHHHVHGAL
jgi:hypothetical protein